MSADRLDQVKFPPPPEAHWVGGRLGGNSELDYRDRFRGCLLTVAAGDALGWLAAGAETADWWTLDNGANGNTGGTCSKPDEGMFTTGTKPTGETYYVGYLLASQLAKPSAQLSVLSTSNPGNVLAYKSVLANGKIAIALINTNTSSAEKVTYTSGLTGTVHVYGYKAASQNKTNTLVSTGKTTASKVAKGLTVPKESITILTEN